MSLRLGSRHEVVLQSEIRNMSIECDRMGGINLSQGVCDVEVPEVVRRGAHEAIEQGINSYTRYDGIERLRQAIAVKQERFTGMKVDPANEVVVSAGATGALYCACLALLDPGDEVILFEPYYGYHVQTLEAAEAVPVYARTGPPNWAFTAAELEAARTPRTRALVICNPANPSGKVYSRAELEVIAEFARRHGLFVFTDEIYEHFIYEGEHIPLATLPGMDRHVITISGLSKTFNITGWRIGYSLSHPDWTQAIGHFNDLVYVCAPAPLQMGVATGLLELGDEYYQGLSRMYRDKRACITGALTEAGLEPYVPAGAYYVLADISALPGADSKQRAMRLLRDTGVACVPGEAFYHDDAGEDLARFCFAKRDEELDEACRRLSGVRY